MERVRPGDSERQQNESPGLSVSVVVPSYRRPDSLLSCLDGLERQSRLPDQVVVVLRDEDEESQRRVAEWVGRSSRLGKRVEVAIVDRPGQIPAMNVGLAAAWGDVVAFTDDDCVPKPDWIERMLSHYGDETVGGVGGRDVVHEGGRIIEGQVRVVGKYEWFGRPVGNHHLELVGGQPVDVDLLKGANMSFRRRLMCEFDEALQMGSAQCNDMDMSLHVRRQGYRLIYDPACRVDHYPAQRFGESTRQGDAPHMLFAEGHNWMYVVLKHARWWQVPVLIVYGFLVGHARAYGLLRALLGVVRDGPRLAARRLYHSLRGKIRGLRTWLRRGRSR